MDISNKLLKYITAGFLALVLVLAGSGYADSVVVDMDTPEYSSNLC